MPFYIKNKKLLGWDKCIKKAFKTYFMIKITHKVSIMQLASYDNATLDKKTRVSDIITSFLAFNCKDFCPQVLHNLSNWIMPTSSKAF